MHTEFDTTRLQAETLYDTSLERQMVDISQSGLLAALTHARQQKNLALDGQRWGEATSWKDREKDIAGILAGLGQTSLQDS